MPGVTFEKGTAHVRSRPFLKLHGLTPDRYLGVNRILATTTASDFSAGTDRSIGADSLSAPFLRGNVGERLRERPLVARMVLGVVLSLAVLEVGRLHEDVGAVLPGPFTVGTCILNAHHHQVCDLSWTGRTAITSYIAEDHGPVAEPELSAMVLADPPARRTRRRQRARRPRRARRGRSGQG